MLRCFVSDLDGTLLDDNDSIAVESAAIIKQAMKQGYEFMIASGRSKESVDKLLKSHQISCIRILCNGALILAKDDSILYSRLLDTKRIEAMISILEQLCFDVQLYTSKGHVAFNANRIFQRFVLETMKKRNLTRIQAEAYINEHFCFDYQEIVSDWDSYLKKAPVIYKLEAYCDEEAALHKAIQSLKTVENIDVNVVKLGLEITDISAQKKTALDWLLKKLDIDKHEVAVFGDGMNDLRMIESYPYSFAPQNAAVDIKEAAAYVIDANDKQGVAKTIQRIMTLQKDI